MTNPGGPSVAEPGVADVELVVRAVMEAMFGPKEPTSRTKGSPASAADPTLFEGRLITLAQAEAWPSAFHEVRIAPGTVVTPMARDHFRRRGVEIRWASRSDVDRARNPGEWGLAIESTSGVVEAFRRSMLDGEQPWVDIGASLSEAVAWVVEAESRGAMILTDESALAVYRAGQIPGVRPASAFDPESAAKAVRGIGANLLAVEPSGKSIALMRQIGQAMRRLGGPVAPDWLQRESRS